MSLRAAERATPLAPPGASRYRAPGCPYLVLACGVLAMTNSDLQSRRSSTHSPSPALSRSRSRSAGPSPTLLPATSNCHCACTCGSTWRSPRPEAWLAAPGVYPRSLTAAQAFAQAPPVLAAPSTPADLEEAAPRVVHAKPSRYDSFASAVSEAAGTPWCFYGAALGVVAWAACGAPAHGSDTWQLVLNTSSSIITMLMCFILQNTLNRDTRVLHLQLQRLMDEVAALQGPAPVLPLPTLAFHEAPDASGQAR